MNNDDDSDIPEQDFSNAVQGKHFAQYWASHGLIEVAPDLRDLFPTAESVNDALRLLLSIKQQVGAA